MVGVVVVDVEDVEVVLGPGASVVVGDWVGGGGDVVVVDSEAAGIVVEVVMLGAGVGSTVLEEAGSGTVVDVARTRVVRLAAVAWDPGRSLPQLPTLPTAAVARRIDATVATSQAKTDMTLRLTLS